MLILAAAFDVNLFQLRFIGASVSFEFGFLLLRFLFRLRRFLVVFALALLEPISYSIQFSEHPAFSALFHFALSFIYLSPSPTENADFARTHVHTDAHGKFVHKQTDLQIEGGGGWRGATYQRPSDTRMLAAVNTNLGTGAPVKELSLCGCIVEYAVRTNIALN